jgi:hypothetical protein
MTSATTKSRRIIAVGQSGFRIDGPDGAIAEVFSFPTRSLADAEAIAERIAQQPDEYLGAIRDFGVPGVCDLHWSNQLIQEADSAF